MVIKKGDIVMIIVDRILSTVSEYFSLLFCRKKPDTKTEKEKVVAFDNARTIQIAALVLSIQDQEYLGGGYKVRVKHPLFNEGNWITVDFKKTDYDFSTNRILALENQKEWVVHFKDGDYTFISDVETNDIYFPSKQPRVQDGKKKWPI